MRAAILVLTLICVVPAITHGAIIHVPADFSNIQDAIDAAMNGDTVLVAPGTYVENIDFKGKALAVRSGQRPDNTIIDGNQAGSVVTFKSGEGAGSILAGFTVTNGSSTSGCGIYCENASPTIINNAIVKNTTSGLFTSGGGIFCLNTGDANIGNNLIRENKSGFGGGICCYGSSPVISYNVIEENWSTYGGGGIGGGESSLTIMNNCFSGNTGGAIYFDYECTSLIVNNTLSRNTGGGVVCVHSTMICLNTILWSNDPPSGPEIRLIDSSTLTIDCSDVMGGEDSVDVGPGCTLHWGACMIEADPAFVDGVNGDLHITFSSPCRGSGDNDAPGLPIYDFEGDPRIYQSAVDIGADEFYTHLYITGDATPGGYIHAKFEGLPGKTPVVLFIGSGPLPSPVPTQWGNFFLQTPLFQFGPLGHIPSSGIMMVTTQLPMSAPAPYDLYMQALIGLNTDSLTNLCVLQVR